MAAHSFDSESNLNDRAADRHLTSTKAGVDSRPYSSEAAQTLSFTKALREWREVLGDEYVSESSDVRDKFARSTAPWNTRPSAVLRPASTEEVQRIVRIAARFEIPLYPISRGKNWGFGDACAVSDGQVIVDLGRLDRIHEVNVPLAYAVVEPGVTQQQLYDYLCDNKLPLWCDATGAGPDASVIGNIMERGYGHTLLGDRYLHSCNYEVVLPSGEVVSTGFGHYSNAQSAHLFKTGIGPALDGLFTQSNLGIVTRMTVWLMPKPEYSEAVFFQVEDDEQLSHAVDVLRYLRSHGVLRSAVHIANDLRVLSAHTRYPWNQTDGEVPLPGDLRQSMRQKRGLGAWNVLGALYGPKRLVQSARHVIRESLRSIARPKFISDSKLRWGRRLAEYAQRVGIRSDAHRLLESVQSAYGLLQGKPSRDHLHGAAWRNRQPPNNHSLDPLDNNSGLMWISPVLPMTGEAASELLDTVLPVLADYGFDPLLTFILVNDRAMCCPLTICYDKTDAAESTRAAECYESLFLLVLERGFQPYRCGIHSMQQLHLGSTQHWEVVGKIKDSFDPQHILAPGRYEPY